MLTVRWRILLSGLKEAWPMWLFLGGVGSALAIAWAFAWVFSWVFSRTASDAIRYAGMLLQFFGLATVAKGLTQMRSLFKRPSLREKASGWFSRLAAAFSRPKAITLKGEAGGFSLGFLGEGRVTRGTPPGAPLEERVSALEENLRQLQDELDTKVQELRRELSSTKDSVERESRERAGEDQRTNQMIEEVAIGGLHLEIVGLAWLILGVIGTSIPGEIAAWLPPICRPVLL